MKRALLLLLALPLLGCPTAPDDDDTADDDDVDPCEGIPTVAGTDIDLETVAAGLDFPVHVTHAGDGSGRLFVSEQNGAIVAISVSGTQSTFLDISSRVSSGGERGLLSVAFHPEFSANGRFFVYYTASGGGATTVSEFGLDGDGNGDPGSERVLLTEAQPAANHNGGQIAFGPDGYLYIGLGDGGGAGDNFGNGQRQDTFHAKILRIDVNSGDPYGIPDDNPFIGVEDHRPETYMWGLRNPWRFSFDRQTGDVWIADVGQGDWEEVDIGYAGANFGWPEAEGNHCYTPGCDLSAYEGAVFEYDHFDGISITGGFVYRGCRMPDLKGVYFYSDYNYFNSPLWSLTWDGSSSTEAGPVTLGSTTGLISSFGEGELGELYVCDHTGGRLWKIVPAE